jgi:hypothetical protein
MASGLVAEVKFSIAGLGAATAKIAFRGGPLLETSLFGLRKAVPFTTRSVLASQRLADGCPDLGLPEVKAI